MDLQSYEMTDVSSTIIIGDRPGQYEALDQFVLFHVSSLHNYFAYA